MTGRRVRGLGAHIKGTNGESQGVVPFLKVANDTAIAVNQGGKRKGAVCAYLETWHVDIEEFLDLSKNTGDDRRRTHDMNTANWVPDLFMQRVEEDSHWTLFSPDEDAGPARSLRRRRSRPSLRGLRGQGRSAGR
jgi:ribonucleoside-diphosphate reductase alpha chain